MHVKNYSHFLNTWSHHLFLMQNIYFSTISFSLTVQVTCFLEKLQNHLSSESFKVSTNFEHKFSQNFTCSKKKHQHNAETKRKHISLNKNRDINIDIRDIHKVVPLRNPSFSIGKNYNQIEWAMDWFLHLQFFATNGEKFVKNRVSYIVYFKFIFYGDLCFPLI